MRSQIEAALEKIRPSLQQDGGDIELVGVSEDGVVTVRLTGACGGCPMSQMTLRHGVERLLKGARSRRKSSGISIIRASGRQLLRVAATPSV